MIKSRQNCLTLPIYDISETGASATALIFRQKFHNNYSPSYHRLQIGQENALIGWAAHDHEAFMGDQKLQKRRLRRDWWICLMICHVVLREASWSSDGVCEKTTTKSKTHSGTNVSRRDSVCNSTACLYLFNVSPTTTFPHLPNSIICIQFGNSRAPLLQD